MPLTCPLHIVPAIYDSQTRLAFSSFWRQPAAPLANQIISLDPMCGRGRGLWTGTLFAARPQLPTVCADVLARDTVLQDVLHKHLEHMDANAQTRFHAIYYPDSVGLIAVDACDRGVVRRCIRLICEPIRTQAEAIARHDDYVSMTRGFGDAVRRYDAALAAELRFPTVGALLPRERGPRGRKTACNARQGELLLH